MDAAAMQLVVDAKDKRGLSRTVMGCGEP